MLQIPGKGRRRRERRRSGHRAEGFVRRPATTIFGPLTEISRQENDRLAISSASLSTNTVCFGSNPRAMTQQTLGDVTR